MIECTHSPNSNDIDRNYSKPESSGSSLSYREITPVLKIELIEKEFNDSLAQSMSEENFQRPSDRAFVEARELIPKLILFDEPLVSFIADGSIVFQWTRNEESVLTLSVCGEGRIVFAGIFNRTKINKKLSGALPIENNAIPGEILKLLTKYFPDEKFQWVI